MFDSHETVTGRNPFTVQRIVRWQECDPAGVVYTGRFSDYVLDTLILFIDELHSVDGNAGSRERQQRVTLPMKRMELLFHASLYPKDTFQLEVKVLGVRTHTFDMRVLAKLMDGRVAFEAQCTPISIRPTAREKTPLPDWFVEKLSQHA